MTPPAAPLSAHFRGKGVLIAGGLGFLGSNLARTLVEAGARVALADNLFPQFGGNRFNVDGVESRLHIAICDVRDQEKLQRLVVGQDYLFNLVGQTSHMDSMQEPFVDLDINARAQLAILETCRQHNPEIRIVFASTRQVYGRPDYLPVDERHALRPVDINGINKIAGESYHILYNNVHGTRTCALRLTNTYGPRMRVKDARQTFLGLWIRLLVEGKPFEVWGGEQWRDFTYVDDMTEAFLIAASSDISNGKIYNIGGDRAVTLTQAAELAAAANGGGGYSVCPFPADRKRIDIGDYYADYRLVAAELGWAPRVSLEQGLERTIRYYRDHLAKYL
jgi:UDP-glucose 4-epimerase